MLPKALQRGFTLIELAIVLAVIGLLLGGVLLPLATQVKLQRFHDTHEKLSHIKEALIGYAIANRRLPCPDTDRIPNGVENPSCSGGTEGNLPYASLGISNSNDAWGRPFRYRSDDNFNDENIPFPPDTQRISATGMKVVNLFDEVLTDTSLDTNNPVAIIYSCGPNGIPDGENDSDLIVNSDANCGGNVSATPNNTYLQGVAERTSTEGEFDDLLVWLSKNILIARLAAAGTWP